MSFGVVFLILLAAVPALGWAGKERLLDSKGGTVVDATRSSGDPGYRVLVDPTQTALVIQRDPDGDVVATTLLALGMGQTGGTVLQIPMDTALRVPQYTLDRLAQVAENASTELFVRSVEDRLNVAVGSTIELDDERLAELVSPVAPLTVDIPDPVVLDSGESYDSGPVTLEADDLGPFLRATSESSEIAGLERNSLVWEAWLDAIGSSDTSDSVGPATTGIGPFLRTLSAGEPVVETLDVEEDTDVTNDDPTYVIPLVPAPGFDEQIIDAVPFPRSPALGRRYNLTLLNGVDGEELPRELMHDLILRGAALTYLGNAEEFGQDTTTVRYSNEGWEELADLAGQTLGGAEVSQMTAAQAEAEGEDVVITVGQDTLDRYQDGG